MTWVPSKIAFTATPASGVPIETRSLSTQFVPRSGVRARAATADAPAAPAATTTTPTTPTTTATATTTVRRIRVRLGSAAVSDPGTPRPGGLDTSDERRDLGRALRADTPRSAHAEWSVSERTHSPVDVLEQQARTRVAELIPVRYERMAESPFAFFRGAAAVMAMDLSTTPVTGLTVQACGDAHVANFGTFATPGRTVVFDINDFDETDPGPWEWDVKRLAASLHVVARQRGFPTRKRDEVVLEAVRVYREYLEQYAAMRTLDVWYERTTAADLLEHFPPRYRAQAKRDLTRALRKDHLRAVAKLTTDAGGRPAFVENPPIVVHLDDDRPRPRRGRRDGRRLPVVAGRRPAVPPRPVPHRRCRPPRGRGGQCRYPVLGLPVRGIQQHGRCS